MTTAFTLLSAGLGLAAAGSVLYLLILLAAAVFPGRRSPDQRDAAPLRFAIVVPAHNEELVLQATLESLQAQQYPADQTEIVVVADNCTDATAAIARQAGVTVLERSNPVERGKGYALDWVFQQILNRPNPPDACAIVDADTWVAPDFLQVMAAQLTARRDTRGRCALQGRYGVLNSGEGWRASLMTAALDLFNHVRPRGADRLGLTVGLKGNGMAVTVPVLQQARWQGHSITEDIDYGLDLLLHHDLRVGYVPEARVLAQMPVSSAQAASQRARWEGGRQRLLREKALPLAWEGVRRRDVRLLAASLDLLVRPLAELGALLGLWAGVILVGAITGWLPDAGRWLLAACLSASGLGLYIIGGLRSAGAPAAAYRALLQAPVYLIWKLALYGKSLLRRRQSATPEWVRTERAPIPASSIAEDSAA